ncbi:uncharacterized protein [Littorina saxatilis]|uniref:uncharacterized protein n=1 Tax=Littorina saxatilis TaxID=31220 RepID=UPI0038B5AC9A
MNSTTDTPSRLNRTRPHINTSFSGAAFYGTSSKDDDDVSSPLVYVLTTLCVLGIVLNSIGLCNLSLSFRAKHGSALLEVIGYCDLITCAAVLPFELYGLINLATVEVSGAPCWMLSGVDTWLNTITILVALVSQLYVLTRCLRPAHCPDLHFKLLSRLMGCVLLVSLGFSFLEIMARPAGLGVIPHDVKVSSVLREERGTCALREAMLLESRGSLTDTVIATRFVLLLLLAGAVVADLVVFVGQRNKQQNGVGEAGEATQRGGSSTRPETRDHIHYGRLMEAVEAVVDEEGQPLEDVGESSDEIIRWVSDTLTEDKLLIDKNSVVIYIHSLLLTLSLNLLIDKVLECYIYGRPLPTATVDTPSRTDPPITNVHVNASDYDDSGRTNMDESASLARSGVSRGGPNILGSSSTDAERHRSEGGYFDEQQNNNARDPKKPEYASRSGQPEVPQSRSYSPERQQSDTDEQRNNNARHPKKPKFASRSGQPEVSRVSQSRSYSPERQQSDTVGQRNNNARHPKKPKFASRSGQPEVPQSRSYSPDRERQQSNTGGQRSNNARHSHTPDSASAEQPAVSTLPRSRSKTQDTERQENEDKYSGAQKQYSGRHPHKSDSASSKQPVVSPVSRNRSNTPDTERLEREDNYPGRSKNINARRHKEHDSTRSEQPAVSTCSRSSSKKTDKEREESEDKYPGVHRNNNAKRHKEPDSASSQQPAVSTFSRSHINISDTEREQSEDKYHGGQKNNNARQSNKPDSASKVSSVSQSRSNISDTEGQQSEDKYPGGQRNNNARRHKEPAFTPILQQTTTSSGQQFNNDGENRSKTISNTLQPGTCFCGLRNANRSSNANPGSLPPPPHPPPPPRNPPPNPLNPSPNPTPACSSVNSGPAKAERTKNKSAVSIVVDPNRVKKTSNQSTVSIVVDHTDRVRRISFAVERVKRMSLATSSDVDASGTDEDMGHHYRQLSISQNRFRRLSSFDGLVTSALTYLQADPEQQVNLRKEMVFQMAVNRLKRAEQLEQSGHLERNARISVAGQRR